MWHHVRKIANIAGLRTAILRKASCKGGLWLVSGNLDLERVFTILRIEKRAHYA